MYLLLSQRGPVKVAVSVLCKDWTERQWEQSPEPGPPTAATRKEGMADGTRGGTLQFGWSDGALDQALWFPVVIFS